MGPSTQESYEQGLGQVRDSDYQGCTLKGRSLVMSSIYCLLAQQDIPKMENQMDKKIENQKETGSAYRY